MKIQLRMLALALLCACDSDSLSEDKARQLSVDGSAAVETGDSDVDADALDADGFDTGQAETAPGDDRADERDAQAADAPSDVRQADIDAGLAGGDDAQLANADADVDGGPADADPDAADGEASDGDVAGDASDAGAANDAEAGTDATVPTYAELDQQVLGHFDSCAAIGEGEYHRQPIVDELGRCAARCFLAAPCLEVRARLCKQSAQTHKKLSSCLMQCVKPPTDPALVCGTSAIWLSWLCDGDKHCAALEDEQGCTGYQCADGELVTRNGAHCDGVLSCKDGSDEAGCASVCPNPLP